MGLLHQNTAKLNLRSLPFWILNFHHVNHRRQYKFMPQEFVQHMWCIQDALAEQYNYTWNKRCIYSGQVGYHSLHLIQVCPAAGPKGPAPVCRCYNAVQSTGHACSRNLQETWTVAKSTKRTTKLFFRHSTQKKKHINTKAVARESV